MNLHIDLFDLKLFAYAATAQSLTRGADKACISLAAASSRIKLLEKAVGNQLLHRTVHGVQTTAAGEALLHHAKRVMQQMEHLHIEMQNFGSGLKGRVHVFANPYSISERLPERLAEFLTRHPDVQIDLQEYSNEEIVRSVSDGSADIGILASDIQAQHFDIRPFGHNQLVLVMPVTHRLASAGQVAFCNTLDEPHVGLHSSSAIRQLLQRKAELAGLEYKPRIQMSSFEVICLMIAAGVGIGVLPASSARRLGKALRLTTVLLSDPWASRELQLIARNRELLPASARDLFDHLAQAEPTAGARFD